MALAGALTVSSNLIGGFSNKTIRPLISGLLGEPYNQARCCYDLRRLKHKGLIRKVQHTNNYVLTADGQRFAIFYTKVGNRVLAELIPDRDAAKPPSLHRLSITAPDPLLTPALETTTFWW